MVERTKRRISCVLALLMCGAAFAQTEQAIRDELFSDTDAVKTQADELNAKMLAPDSYGEAIDLYLEAGEELDRGRDLDRVRENLTEATGYFQQSIERAELAHITFTNALAAREAALAADAPTYAERDWSRAEDDLMDAAERLEGGNLNRAEDDGRDAEERYREAESAAIANKAEADAR